MRVRVDKTGSHNQVVGIDGAFGLTVDFADFGDDAIADGDISLLARRAGSVYDSSVFDNEIMGHCGRLRTYLR